MLLGLRIQILTGLPWPRTSSSYKQKVHSLPLCGNGKATAEAAATAETDAATEAAASCTFLKLRCHSLCRVEDVKAQLSVNESGWYEAGDLRVHVAHNINFASTCAVIRHHDATDMDVAVLNPLI